MSSNKAKITEQADMIMDSEKYIDLYSQARLMDILAHKNTNKIFKF